MTDPDPERGDEETDDLLGRRHAGWHYKKVRRAAEAYPNDGSFRGKVHMLLDEPTSSTSALLVTCVMVSTILVSTIAFCLETEHSFGSQYEREFAALEVCVISIFTLEYFLRLWSRKYTFCGWFWKPMNLIDLASILPFYLGVVWVHALGHSRGFILAVDLRALRVCYLVRILKVGRFSHEMQVISKTLTRSMSSLLMLVVMLILTLVMFGTMMFLVERGEWDAKEDCYARPLPMGGCSPFQSVPDSFWFVMTTITTVGYGDQFPVTDAGRAVGGLSQVVGLLTVALPITILGVRFASEYKEVVLESEVRKAMKQLPHRSELRNEMEEHVAQVEVLLRELDNLMPELKDAVAAFGRTDLSRKLPVEHGFEDFWSVGMKSARTAKGFLCDAVKLYPGSVARGV